jgi:hypothetical protein
MSEYPLVFTFRDAVSGKGFLAGVTMNGRGVMTEEDGAWWVYGVRPAGSAGTGETPPEAYGNYRTRYREVLFDIATEVDSFETFKLEVEKFFNESDAQEEARWQAAVDALRTGATTTDGPFAALPREPAESRPPMIGIERLDEATRVFTPSDNIPDVFATAA